jgi:hypothetical protein
MRRVANTNRVSFAEALKCKWSKTHNHAEMLPEAVATGYGREMKYGCEACDDNDHLYYLEPGSLSYTNTVAAPLNATAAAVPPIESDGRTVTLSMVVDHLANNIYIKHYANKHQ